MAEEMMPKVPTPQEDEAELSTLYPICCSFMNYTWELDPQTVQNIKNCMEEARDYLRNKAGNPGVSFLTGENRNLFKTCVWYLVENKKAEFEREYAPDLTSLRLREGFGCGR